MRIKIIQRILGLLLTLFSLALVPPLLISLWSGDGAFHAFSLAFVIILLIGFFLWLPVRKVRQELRLRDGFLVVVLFWLVLGTCGAIPLILADHPHLSAADAVFESISALTTTGATVIVGIDYLPTSVLFYRQQLQWMGGMGIIVLAVAILPMLGIGGMQLYRAETPGPIKDNKLTPRVTETAKALWYIYLGLTVACCLSFWLAGMSLFDAIGHSFSTVAIGGFSTHDLSLGYFNNPLIEGIAVFFMLVAGVNFSLHFLAWRHNSLKAYILDAELLTFLKIMLAVSVVSCVYLYYTGTYNIFDAIRYGVFHAVSIGTTTGFATTDYQSWPNFLPVLLLFASFAGGCAGSTGGGLKVIRILLLFKQGMREIKRLIHPSAVIPIRIGGKPVPDRVIDAVWGFFATYVATFTIMMMMVMATGLDQVTAFSAVGACMNNLGPGLGGVGLNYADISDAAKWILCVAMMLGRLEIFTLLVLITPGFWRS